MTIAIVALSDRQRHRAEDEGVADRGSAATGSLGESLGGERGVGHGG